MVVLFCLVVITAKLGSVVTNAALCTADVSTAIVYAAVVSIALLVCGGFIQI